MANDWNYSGDPSQDDKDAIRWEIGDTIEDDPLLTDSEINYALNSERNIYTAAARCCEAIAAKFSRQAQYSLGPVSVHAQQRAEAYRKRARELWQKGTGGPTAGGIEDEPAFKRDLMNNRVGEGDPRWTDK